MVTTAIGSARRSGAGARARGQMEPVWQNVSGKNRKWSRHESGEHAAGLPVFLEVWIMSVQELGSHGKKKKKTYDKNTTDSVYMGYAQTIK